MLYRTCSSIDPYRPPEDLRQAKPMMGLEDDYLITPSGNIWCKKRQRLLALYVQPNTGHVLVSLRGPIDKDTNRRCPIQLVNVKVAELVALNFLSREGVPEHFTKVHLIDGNYGNTHVSNLKWAGTQQRRPFYKSPCLHVD